MLKENDLVVEMSSGKAYVLKKMFNSVSGFTRRNFGQEINVKRYAEDLVQVPMIDFAKDRPPQEKLSRFSMVRAEVHRVR